MAEKLAELRGRIGSMRELRELFGAMRSLAAARLHQAEQTLGAVREYADAIAAGLADALAMGAAPPSAAAGTAAGLLIAISAEHGFAGAFSARVLVEAARTPAPSLMVIGSRGVAQLGEHGLSASWTHAMATQLGAIEATAHEVAEELYRRVAAGSVGDVTLLFGVRNGVARRRLLPVDATAIKARRRRWPPLTHLPPPRLVERMIDEYVFGELANALAESFAAENAARLQTMQSARVHVEERLAELELRERRARQEQITDELLELATGAAAALR